MSSPVVHRMGGFGGKREMTEEVKGLAVGLKDEIFEALGERTSVFEPLSYKSQVVAGTNYVISIDVGKEEPIEVKIYKPLPHTGEPARLL